MTRPRRGVPVDSDTKGPDRLPPVTILFERLRSRLWPIPATAAVVAGVLAAALSMVRPDADSGPVWWPGEASSARGLLEVLAGASLTVVALVFSLQVVALQLAATQYSPRLLRTYARDGWIQGSLAVLIATFVFSLMTLALFGTVDRPPRVSVTVALLLGLASVFALVGVVAHIVSSLRVETMMAGIHADAQAVIESNLAGDMGARRPDWPPPARAGDAGAAIPASRPGFVQSVDRARLAAWAHTHDAYVRLTVGPGAHVLADQPLGRVWPQSRDGAGVVSAVLIGHERTPDEDPGFGLVQISDVAVRALSPGINDPTTAVHAVGHLAALMGTIARTSPGPDRWTPDSDGTLRIQERVPVLKDYLNLAYRPVVRSGSSHPQVLHALLDLLGHVAACSPHGPEAVRDDVEYLCRAADRGLDDQSDRDGVRTAASAMLA